jgi:hypothetical protein
MALSGESMMDMLLGGLAFAAIVFAQFAAVVAVHGERKSRESEAPVASHFDHRARLIWDSGS